MKIAIWPEVIMYDDSPGYKHSCHQHLIHSHSHRTISNFYGYPATLEADHWLLPVLLSYATNDPERFQDTDYIPLSEEIVRKIRQNKMTVVFDHSTESFDFMGIRNDPESQEFCKRVGFYDYTYEIVCNTIEHFNLPRDRCILTHACPADYPEHPLFHMCYVNYFENMVDVSSTNLALERSRKILRRFQDSYVEQMRRINQRSIRKYKTTCLMSRVREGRIWFAYQAYKDNLLDDNFISLGVPQPHTNFTGQDDPEFIATLPWRVEGVGSYERRSHGRGEFESLMNDAYVNISHESYDDTIPWKLGKHYRFVTEKTFYNLLSCKPFVVQAYPGTLEYVHSLGYETFAEWWKEDYDQSSGYVRLGKVWDIYKNLNSLTRAELADMLYEMKDVLNHNRNNYIQRQDGHLHMRELQRLLKNLLN